MNVTTYNEVFKRTAFKPEKRLRTCQAWVRGDERYLVLKSYNTVVAVFDKKEDICYDILRAVFGFTSTSCQHIRKFREDYCPTAKYVRIDDWWA